MEINRRVHKQNNVPKEFPLFVRNGYSIKVVADDYQLAPSGLMFKASLPVYPKAACTICALVSQFRRKKGFSIFLRHSINWRNFCSVFSCYTELLRDMTNMRA